MKPRWAPKSAVLAIHEWLLAEHGGPAGVRDEAALDSALASPRNLLAYGRPDVFELAAQCASALTRDHPFHDGNKRVAFTVAGVFLELNGFRLIAPEAEAVAAMLALTTRQLDEKGLAAWLRENTMKLAAGRKPRARRKQARSESTKRRLPKRR